MTKSTVFFNIGLIAVGFSLLTLFLLNLMLFTHITFNGIWYVPVLSVLFAILALTQKTSRKYGLYALFLTIGTLLLFICIVCGLLSINGTY